MAVPLRELELSPLPASALALAAPVVPFDLTVLLRRALVFCFPLGTALAAPALRWAVPGLALAFGWDRRWVVDFVFADWAADFLFTGLAVDLGFAVVLVCCF